MKILFVCTGNTCRSPMAMALYNAKSNTNDASSAGLAVYGKKGASANAILVMQDRGIDLTKHISKQITISDIESNDIVLTMTKAHASMIKNTAPHLQNKVYSLSEYIGESEDIVDPYGGDVKEYEECAKMIEKYIEKIINKV